MIWNRMRSADSRPTLLGVAHVAFSLQTGGMERLLVEFARRADRACYRLHYFSLTDRGAPADDIAACGWPITSLAKPAGFRWSTVWRLAREFRRLRIGVVHTHNSGAMIYGAMAARLAGVPAVIHTRHGQRFGAGRRQTWSFIGTSRLVDRVVGVSQDCTQQSLREGVSARRACTVWNGIDLCRFAYGPPQPAQPAVLVSRLVPEKDLPTLWQAVACLIRREPAFRLRVVGDGPCMPSAVEAVARLGLAHHVELLGERKDVAEILRQSSMFVLSSRTEGVSLTLLEAMASGLPVVATDAGGNAEVVEHGMTGYLVPVGDSAQMAAAVGRLWREPVVARQLGKAGRARVERHFDVNRMVRQYEGIYQEVLGERTAGRLPCREGEVC